MKKFDNDVKRWTDYDFVSINDDLETCFQEIEGVIQKKLKDIDVSFDKNKIYNHVNKLLK